jgi:hypothetical protein
MTAAVAASSPTIELGAAMSDGFQTDLNDLNALATIDVPHIGQTCADARTTLKTVDQKDATVFEMTSNRDFHGEEVSQTVDDVWGSFNQARLKLEDLLSALSTSLESCAKALHEIYDRYNAQEDHISSTLDSIGSGR